MDNSSPDAINALQMMGTAISSCMVAILTFMVCLGFSALVYRAALGSQKELRVFNLGKVPSELKVFNALVDIATYMTEEGKSKEEKFMKDLKALSVYDLSAVTRALDILADDLEMAVSHSMRSTSSSRRIAAGKRTSRGTRDSTQSGQSRDSGIEPAAVKAGSRKGQESRLGARCVASGRRGGRGEHGDRARATEGDDPICVRVRLIYRLLASDTLDGAA